MNNLSKDNIITSRQFGIIRYSEAILNESPEIIQKIFSKIIPLQIRYDFIQEFFEVQCASEHFDPINFGQIIPEYDVIITTQNRKIIHKWPFSTAWHVEASYKKIHYIKFKRKAT